MTGTDNSSYNPLDPHNVPRKIYILGIGSIGKLIAHSLCDLPNPPPITLLLHRGDLYTEWLGRPKEITITTKGVSVTRRGFDAEMARYGWRRYGRRVSVDEFLDPPTDPRQFKEKQEPESPDIENVELIHNLIVTVKTPNTVGALLAVKHRLSPSSSILFLQNGMGIIEQVNEKVFTDPATRPHYMQGVISHGVNSQGPWEATHAGQGTIQLGLTPSAPPHEVVWSASSRYMLRTLCRSPVLAAVGIAPTELLQAQLEKLAVNAIVNPLTALIDARNGGLLYNFALQRAMRLLLAEISVVIRSLPELRSLPNVSTRFGADRLEMLAIDVANKTAGNVSSMLADVRQGKRTEIEYINGYIVRRGEELGIKCFMNYLVVQLIKGKQMLIDREHSEQLPLSAAKGEDAFEKNLGGRGEWAAGGGMIAVIIIFFFFITYA